MRSSWHFRSTSLYGGRPSRRGCGGIIVFVRSGGGRDHGGGGFGRSSSCGCCSGSCRSGGVHLFFRSFRGGFFLIFPLFLHFLPNSALFFGVSHDGFFQGKVVVEFSEDVVQVVDDDVERKRDALRTSKGVAEFHRHSVHVRHRRIRRTSTRLCLGTRHRSPF